MKKTVIVGMSGGVDSSVAAHLLQQQGYIVIGVFMKNWDDIVPNPSYRQENESGCQWEDDLRDAQAVAEMLGIPLRVYNFVKEYRDTVFSTFLEELKNGRTPNPDIACNQEIKFHLFLKRALQEEGVEYVATGHYAAITNGKLTRPRDRNKDQTYFLHRIDPAVLPHVLFPLADLTKDEVRRIAQEQHFPNADKKDSTGICFIGDINYADFINQHIPKKPGEIQTTEGTVIGTHQGLHFYTIGQRKGIDIGGTGPYYVVEKDLQQNVLIVANNPNDSRLYHTRCTVEQMHWLVAKGKMPEFPFQCTVQIRYRQEAQPATVHSSQNGTIMIEFDQPQRATTPGQSAVLYDGDIVLGGGIIEHAA